MNGEDEALPSDVTIEELWEVNGREFLSESVRDDDDAENTNAIVDSASLLQPLFIPAMKDNALLCFIAYWKYKDLLRNI